MRATLRLGEKFTCKFTSRDNGGPKGDGKTARCNSASLFPKHDAGGSRWKFSFFFAYPFYPTPTLSSASFKLFIFLASFAPQERIYVETTPGTRASHCQYIWNLYIKRDKIEKIVYSLCFGHAKMRCPRESLNFILISERKEDKI